MTANWIKEWATVIKYLKKYNVQKILANLIIVIGIILIAIFRPFVIAHPMELTQGLLIATIALVAFCGVFAVQIKFTSRPDIIEKIPNIDDISRGLTETIIIGLITIALIILYLIGENKHLLTAVTLFFLYQSGYFAGGAVRTGLFRR